MTSTRAQAGRRLLAGRRGAAAAVALAVGAALLAAPGVAWSAAGAAGAASAMEALAALACLAAARGGGALRRAWLLFALGQAIWSATDLLAAVNAARAAEVVPAGLIDLLWLLFYVPTTAGIVLVYRRLRPERGWQGVLDGALVAGTVGLLAWGVYLDDALAGAPGAPGDVALMYPVLDTLGLAALAWLVLRHRRALPGWVGGIALAVAVTLVADVAYLIGGLHGVAGHDALAWAAYVVAAGLWVEAAARARRDAGPRTRAPHTTPPAWSGTVPLVCAVAAVAVVSPGRPAEFALGLALAALAALRMLLTSRLHGQLIAERDVLLVTDPLTSAHNRRVLAATLDGLAADAVRTGRPLAAIAFDVDRFKEVNDRFGHAVGDALLVGTAAAAQSALREGDLLVRLGGDEFLVLLPGVTGPEAAVVAERVRRAIDAAGNVVAPGAGVTCSFGVAALPGDADRPDDLLRRADEALYAAKAGGRGRVARGPVRRTGGEARRLATAP